MEWSVIGVEFDLIMDCILYNLIMDCILYNLIMDHIGLYFYKLVK